MVMDESLPQDSADLLEFDPALLLVVIPSDNHRGFEGVVMAMASLVQGGDDFDVVLVGLLASQHDADRSKSVKSFDRQLVGCAEMLAIPMKKLDVDLDDLVVAMVLLIESDQDEASLCDSDVLDTE
jgi:hypothetical protein